MPNFKVTLKVSPSEFPNDSFSCSRTVSTPTILDAYRPLYDLLYNDLAPAEDPNDDS